MILARASDPGGAMDIFCLYIRVKIKADMVDEFKQRFSVLAKHVKDHEPLTLSCASLSRRCHHHFAKRFPFSPGSTRADSDDTSLSADVPFHALPSCLPADPSQTSCVPRTRLRTSS